MVSIRVSLFGTPRVERDGSELASSRRKVMALLAYLACTGQTHSREVLMALLWPEAEPSRARANLRRYLSRLKEWLGGAALDVNRSQVRLSSKAQLWLDVKEFRSRLDQVQQHTHLPSQLCGSCLQALTEATSLYQDHFMAGFGLADSSVFDEWQYFEAETLLRQLADALQRLVGWHASQKDYEPAIAYSRRWLSLDSLHEPAQRQLMRLYAWSGQLAAAVRQYQECARLLEEELGVEPEAETTALYEAIRSRQVTFDVEQPGRLPIESPAAAGPQATIAGNTDSQMVRHNLPAQITPTLGREVELDQVLHSMQDDPDCRLLTLSGPGGSGKTRLAIQAAFLLVEGEPQAFPDGVWFVELASLGDSESVLTAVAQAIYFTFLGDPSQRRQQLLDYLRPKRLLLLLDNFEHLLDQDVLGWMTDLLQVAPHVKVLVTSRIRLNVLGEQVFSVPGLEVPSSDPIAGGLVMEKEPVSYSAVQLFLQSGRRLQPHFEITPQNLNGVVRVCRLVEGMPLGIELAAAWLDLLNPAEIADEIERGLDFLEIEWAGIPERQRSLRAVFNSSWQLLNDQERTALKGLSVFQSSFTIQAVQAVTGVSMKVLRGLMHKSWLKHAPNDRYQIHEILRQYVAERLQADPVEWQAVGERYAAYYAAFLEEQARIMRGPHQANAYLVVGAEFENIRLAWEWGLRQKNLNAVVERMLPAVFRYCELHIRAHDLFNLIDPALQILDAGRPSRAGSQLLVILLVARGAFYHNGAPVRHQDWKSFIPADETAIRQAWVNAQHTGSLMELGFWSIYLAYLYGRILDWQQGAKLLRSLVSQFRRQGQDWELAFTHYMLGLLILVENHFDETVFHHDDTDKQALRLEIEHCLLEALSIFHDLGDQRESIYTQRNLPYMYLRPGDYAGAIAHWQAAQARLRQVGELGSAAGIGFEIGNLYLRLGEFDAAFGEFSSLSQFYHERGYTQFEAYVLSTESLEAVRYGDIDHARTLRERALDISQQVHDLHGEAWNRWELGELYRVSGDSQAAHTWFESAGRLFERNEDQHGQHIFYQRGLGDLAQAAGDYREALRCFQESLIWAQKLRHQWATAYTLSGLGRAALGLYQLETARVYFSRALRLAYKIDHPELLLVGLCGLAGLFAAVGEAERAAELAALVANHKLSWHETRSQAEAFLSRIAGVTPERLFAIQERSREVDLLEVVQRILAEAPESD